MFWCLKRKKPQVRNHEPDEAQASTQPFHKDQVFPDYYHDQVIKWYGKMIVREEHLLSGQSMGHVHWYMKMLKANAEVYKSVAEICPVPWEILAVLHGLESSFNLDKQILNGQSWKKKTTWVPKGLGPFSSFADSCQRAFIHESAHNPIPKKWGVAETALFLERWNGMGYWRKRKASPYLWSYSNIYGGGKYVSDGRYSASAVSKQVGGMVMLEALGFFE